MTTSNSTPKLFSPLPIVEALLCCPGQIVEYYRRVTGYNVQQGLLEWLPGSHNAKDQSQLTMMMAAIADLLADPQNVHRFEIKSFAHPDAKAVNEWLREHDLPIRLSPWESNDIFGVAGKLTFARRWATHANGGYELPKAPNGVGMRFVVDNNTSSPSVYRSINGSYLARIPNRDGYTWISNLSTDQTTMNLYMLARALSTTVSHYPAERVDCSGVIMPQWKITLDEINADWLRRMYTIDAFGKIWSIMEAKMCGEASFGVHGWQFMSGFAASIAALGGSHLTQPSPTDVVFDTDVIVWETIEGNNLPLGVVHIPASNFSPDVVLMQEQID